MKHSNYRHARHTRTFTEYLVGFMIWFPRGLATDRNWPRAGTTTQVLDYIERGQGGISEMSADARVHLHHIIEAFAKVYREHENVED